MAVARRFLPHLVGLPGAVSRQEDRWPLWLPVALGLGDAGYFALGWEPPHGAGLLAAGLALGVTVVALALRPPWARTLAGLLAMLLLGFGLAKLRENRVAAPVLAHAVSAHLTGRVESAEPRGHGALRVVLADLTSGAFDGPAPGRARIAFVRRDALLRPGAWIGVSASLLPPPLPVLPGAGDFGRSDFFDGVGAVGFAYGAAYPGVTVRDLTWRERIGRGVEDLRWRMTARIQAALPGSDGAIAAALITGTRGGIAEEDETALRDAGLAHVLAIAGLHMALVGGGLFWLLRALLAAFPPLALNYPIKKWAAAAALGLSAFYLVISGAAPSAVRAFAMLACALTAVLVDRPALSMRSLALAAAILLILRPEAVTEPGFQMSFAAVAALVAVAEWQSSRRKKRGALWRYGQGIVLTSLVASLATLPYALFHFGRVTHYAVLGNLLAMPVMGFAVMPLAALSVAAMPFGWERVPLHLLGRAIDLMLLLGRFVSGLPGAVSRAPAMPMPALVLISLGGLWCALWRGGLRWLGAIPVLAGAAVMLLAAPPDILVAPDGATVALCGRDGTIAFIGKPKDRFVASGWLAAYGQDDAAMPQALARCDGLGCTARATDGTLVALGRRAQAWDEDCVRADIVVNAEAQAACPRARLALGRADAARSQGVAIRLQPFAVITVRQSRGDRPWAQ